MAREVLAKAVAREARAKWAAMIGLCLSQTIPGLTMAQAKKEAELASNGRWIRGRASGCVEHDLGATGTAGKLRESMCPNVVLRLYIGEHSQSAEQ